MESTTVFSHVYDGVIYLAFFIFSSLYSVLQDLWLGNLCLLKNLMNSHSNFSTSEMEMQNSFAIFKGGTNYIGIFSKNKQMVKSCYHFFLYSDCHLLLNRKALFSVIRLTNILKFVSPLLQSHHSYFVKPCLPVMHSHFLNIYSLCLSLSF